jgi:adenosylhomocysteine nucleosidase
LKVIGVIGAMPIEINLIKDNLKMIVEEEYAGFKFYICDKENIKVILTSCSIGKVNAASCTQILIDKFKVTHIINTGIAGSLSESVKICDIVISNTVTHHDVRKSQMINWFPFKEEFESDKFLIEIAIKAYQKIESIKFNYHIGKIVSGESFISDCNLRNLIIKEHSPHCVEMEGSAIGHVAYINSIPFLIIRSISDNADDNSTNSIIDFEKISANNSALLVLNILDILDKVN